MKKLIAILLQPVVVTVGALILLSVVIYFGGQMLREKGFLSDTWSDGVLIGICAGVWVIAGLIYMYRRYQARKRAQVIEQRLRAQAQEQVASVRPDRKPEIEALEKQFDEALASLQTSRLGKRALYALPWYIIVGPPGSGKTTLLKESSLNFPHMGHSGRGVRGVGGTRNCDWWFTDQGILLDTAGRYTTEAHDHEEWLSFLDMLGKARKHKPINGAMVAISIQDIVGASDEDLVDHSSKIRDRLSELSKELDMVFPIYLVFTKCDLLDGFVETFGSMSREERAQVWGTTLTPQMRQDRDVRAVMESQFDALYENLCSHRLGMLTVDRPNIKRQRIYSLPLQFMAVRDRVLEFVRLLSQPNPYYEGAELRGVYYTSGTQEGAPIDRVLSAMSEAFGLDQGTEKTNGEDITTKSYFIDSLFTEVVFKDKDLARRSAKIQKRQYLLRRVAFYGSAAAMLIAFVMLFVSYFGNSSAIESTRELLERTNVLVKKGTGAPSADQIAVLADLNTSFVELDDSYLGSFLLGRADELHKKVRTKYLRELKHYFLVPCQKYLRDNFEAQRKKGKIHDLIESRRFSERVDLFAMVSGEDPADTEALRRIFEEQNLWSWDPAKVGQRPEIGAESLDHVHLEAFLRIASSGQSDWIVKSDPGALKDARQYLRNNNVSARVADSVTKEKVKDPVKTLGLEFGSFSEGFQFPEQFTKNLSAAIRAGEATLGGFGKTASTPEGKEATRSAIKGDFKKTWRKTLAAYRPEKEHFRNLGQARKFLPLYIGDKSPYTKLYEDARTNLRKANMLTAPTAVGDREIDREWLAACLEDIFKLDEDIRKFVAGTAARQRVLPDLVDGNGERSRALLQAFERARENVGDSVRLNAEPELRSEAATALTMLIGALEDAFAAEAILELQAHWSGVAGDLKNLNASYPFNRTGPTDASMDTFTSLFRKGGEIDAAMQPITLLMSMKVSGKSVVEYSPTFKTEMDRLVRIRDAMFAEGAGASVAFTLTLGGGEHVGDVKLFISDEKEISSKAEPQTRKKFGGLACKWTQADVGGKVQIVVSSEPPQPLDQEPGTIPAESSGPWRFFRVIRSGYQRSEEKVVHCQWSFTYAPAGIEPVQRTATAEITTTSLPNPFVAGFFEGFTFPTQVFEVN